MIYYSKQLLASWQPNLIMLDLEDDLGHIYVTRNTYDQAVLLSDRFNHDIEFVFQKLGCSVQQEDVVSYMVAILPSPINILVPFYHLIENSVKIDVDNTEQAIGILSYLSMNLDFNALLKVPFEVRANLVYTKSILVDYLGHFQDFNFKLLGGGGHIIPEGKTTESVSRTDKKDFELEDKKEEEGFDLDSFFADLGWDAIPIPTLTPATETIENSAQQDNTPTASAPASSSNAKTEKEVYDDIVAKFC